MDWKYIFNILPRLLDALPLTLWITSLSAILSLFLSLIIVWIQIKNIPILKQIVGIYSSFMRSNPGLIHIFVVYYALPLVMFSLFNLDIRSGEKVVFSVVALVLYNSAYIAEFIRPAYQSIDKTQFEAAYAIGLSSMQTHYRIILPQIIPLIIPSLSTALIDILKDSSLLFLIGLVDIMGQAKVINTNAYGVYVVEVYVALAIIFWGLSIIITRLMAYLEKKSSYYLNFNGRTL